MGKHSRENLINVDYAQAGTSVSTDGLGMREMQRRAYQCKDAEYLLIKAPPASGKSRALMFIGLDKLYHQGRKKIIVAVPERSIGGSFKNTDLMSHGFFANWEVADHNNLCRAGAENSKVAAFEKFMNSADTTLVCTHATLRFAFEKLSPSAFNGTVLAVDEFHHVSADLDNNRLGTVLRAIMAESDAHIVAMTGSYFRGDAVPVLMPGDEAKFTSVTFNYYDQLNGYKYLKSLGIGHHFYTGSYTDSIEEVLDLDKKTIIHIPSVNSGESTKDKIEEVGKILDIIGENTGVEEETGIILMRRHDNGQILRVADLVDDTDHKSRARTLTYLTDAASQDRDAVDIIIALGMAKEGFDWPYAEHALTVGYRSSLTEVIQIIGRVTRDSEGKTHAQFTNLLAEPDATKSEVTISVNNMLKAITASLLMEQVLAQNFNFKAKQHENDISNGNTLKVKGLNEPSTERVREVIENDLTELKATILQDDTFAKAAFGGVDPQTTNKLIIPKIIRQQYPDFTETEVEEIRQHVVLDAVFKNGRMQQVDNKRFLEAANQFINVDELSINLIDKINPFQKAFEILSKSVTPNVLKLIEDTIQATRSNMTREEALALYPKAQAWSKVNGRKPQLRTADPEERQLAEAVIILVQAAKNRPASLQNQTDDEPSGAAG